MTLIDVTLFKCLIILLRTGRLILRRCKMMDFNDFTGQYQISKTLRFRPHFQWVKLNPALT